MPYIDKEKIDYRLPYFRDADGDALVPVSAVRNMLNFAIVDGVAPVEEVVNKIRASIGETIVNPNNKFDFIYDEIFDILDKVLEEYNGKKDT
jgi:hypothetical protein